MHSRRGITLHRLMLRRTRMYCFGHLATSVGNGVKLAFHGDDTDTDTDSDNDTDTDVYRT